MEKVAEKRIFGIRYPSLAAIAFTLFLFRDVLYGALRYIFLQYSLDFLLYAPDFFGFLVLLLFVVRALARGSVIGVLLVSWVLVSICIGIFVMGGGFPTLYSSVRMIVPLFIGLSMTGVDQTRRGGMSFGITLALVVAILGVFVSAVFPMPWVGAQFDIGGITRQVSAEVWTGGLDRLTGFAADSTSASLLILFCMALLPPTAKIYFLLYGFGLWATWLTTNKTGFGGMLVLGSLILTWRLTRWRSLPQVAAAASVSLVFVPLLLMNLFDRSWLYENFFSIYERVEIGWQYPFRYLEQNNPILLFFGCGMGCFSYPALYSGNPSLYAAVDNFYLSTLLMGGIPFLALLFVKMFNAVRSGQAGTCVLLVVFNVCAVTIQGYSPATMLMSLGLVLAPGVNFGAETMPQRNDTSVASNTRPLYRRVGTDALRDL